MYTIVYFERILSMYVHAHLYGCNFKTVRPRIINVGTHSHINKWTNVVYNSSQIIHVYVLPFKGFFRKSTCFAEFNLVNGTMCMSLDIVAFWDFVQNSEIGLEPRNFASINCRLFSVSLPHFTTASTRSIALGQLNLVNWTRSIVVLQRYSYSNKTTNDHSLTGLYINNHCLPLKLKQFKLWVKIYCCSWLPWFTVFEKNIENAFRCHMSYYTPLSKKFISPT